MNAKLLPLLLVAAALAAPFTAAQGTGFSISSTDTTALIPADSTTKIPYTVTFGCLDFASGMSQGYDISLTTDLPAYFNAGSAAVSFAPGPDCLNEAASITKTIDLEIKPTADAWAYVPSAFTVTATDADGTISAEASHEPIQIAYTPGHTMTTSIAFPYEFTDADEGAVEFDINLDITANGDTMVMFENVGANGTVNNLFHQRRGDRHFGGRGRALGLARGGAAIQHARDQNRHGHDLEKAHRRDLPPGTPGKTGWKAARRERGGGAVSTTDDLMVISAMLVNSR